ncbi:MAG: hypothetical protein ACI9MJ_000659 [Alphaproteobacteria bacterium]|jgi:hypothetical protein
MKEQTMKNSFYKTAIAGGLALALVTASSALLAQRAGHPGAASPGGQMHQGAGGPKTSPRVERFNRLYDLNEDGKITVDEINNDQARMFGALDINSDKALSVTEMRRRGRSLQIWRTVTMFDLLDANGDGKISVAEIQGPTKRWFVRHDTNKNGILEADEIPSGRKGRGRGHR